MKEASLSGISLKEQIYSEILEEIVFGNFTPDFVINEKDMMEKFEVSRAPVREALIELCSENIIYSIPYVGYKVVPITEKDISNVKNYRAILECGFLDKFWDSMDEKAIEYLEKVFNDSIEGSMERSALENWQNNTLFHLAFFDIYDNPMAYADLKDSLSVQTRAYAQERWSNKENYRFIDYPRYHGFIIKAIKEKNKDEALRLLKEDILSIGNSV